MRFFGKESGSDKHSLRLVTNGAQGEEERADILRSQIKLVSERSFQEIMNLDSRNEELSYLNESLQEQVDRQKIIIQQLTSSGNVSRHQSMISTQSSSQSSRLSLGSGTDTVASSIDSAEDKLKDGEVRDGEVRDGEVRDGEVRDGEVRDGETKRLKETLMMYENHITEKNQAMAQMHASHRAQIREMQMVLQRISLTYGGILQDDKELASLLMMEPAQTEIPTAGLNNTVFKKRELKLCRNY